MTTLQEAARKALAQQELPQKERPDFMAGYDAGMADAKRMAQQREPVAQARLGMKDGLAMALSVVELYGMKGDVIYREIAKLRDGIAAAPAPQAQDWKKEPEYIPPLVKWAQEPAVRSAKAAFDSSERCGYAYDCGSYTAGYEQGKYDESMFQGPAPQPAQASGRTNPGDETGGAVERFGWQTFLGKSPEIIPATNGSFVWYSDYLKLWQSAQPVHQGERAELIRRLYAIANTEANEVADALNEAADMLQSAQPVAQDVTELVEALEKLARLGNGEHYGNSDGNMIARNALYKYKGAK